MVRVECFEFGGDLFLFFDKQWICSRHFYILLKKKAVLFCSPAPSYFAYSCKV